MTIVDLAGREEDDELIGSQGELEKRHAESKCICDDLHALSEVFQFIAKSKASEEAFKNQAIFKKYRGALCPLLKDSLQSSVNLFIFTLALTTNKGQHTLKYVLNECYIPNSIFV